ncbi:MAG: EF-Tu/IF-2/RF-3 family GTPase [Acutalibacteraceae bacterium]|nr:EF-Tu/IF-2/RF-3 family GTPase [Acutalibacteraceae bacterium]
MGLFDFFKKSSKSDVEIYYEERNNHLNNPEINNQQFSYATNDNSGYSFSIIVEDVFSITRKGTVITGCIKSGSICTGDTVTLQRVDGTSRDVVVAGIEQFRKVLDVAHAGENVGILLRDILKSDIGRGDMLVK